MKSLAKVVGISKKEFPMIFCNDDGWIADHTLSDS